MKRKKVVVTSAIVLAFITAAGIGYSQRTNIQVAMINAGIIPLPSEPQMEGINMNPIENHVNVIEEIIPPNQSTGIGDIDARTPLETLELPRIQDNAMTDLVIPNDELSQVLSKMNNPDRFNNNLTAHSPDSKDIRSLAPNNRTNHVNLSGLIASLPVSNDYIVSDPTSSNNANANSNDANIDNLQSDYTPPPTASAGTDMPDPSDSGNLGLGDSNPIANRDADFSHSTANRIIMSEVDGDNFIYNTDRGLESPVQGYITATYKQAVYVRVRGSMMDTFQFSKLKTPSDVEEGFNFASPFDTLNKTFSSEEEGQLLEYIRALLERHYKSVNPGVQVRIAGDPNKLAGAFTDAWDRWYKWENDALNTRLLYELKVGNNNAYVPYEIRIIKYDDGTLAIDPSFAGSGMTHIDNTTFRVDTTFPLLNKVVTGDDFTSVEQPSVWYHETITNWSEFIDFNREDFIQNISPNAYLPTLRPNGNIIDFVG